jgi:hypothetical protein
MRPTTCLLHQGSPEQRALILLTLLDEDVAQSRYEAALSERLDWHWIFMQAAKHKVLQLIWDNLKRRNLVSLAQRSSGFPKLYVTYLEQLYWLNRERNRIWLDNLERLFATLAEAGISAVCLKGSALIGQLYHPGNRIMQDVDILVRGDDRAEVSALLDRLGYRQGAYDPATASLHPMPPEKKRFWSFHNHVLPKYYLETGVEHCPFYKVSVGFDFFEPMSPYSVPSDEVIARAVPKAADSRLLVPSPADMLINLCAHIYREGVSATYARDADNWELTKFCDLRSFIRRQGDSLDHEAIRQQVRALDLQKPCFFALYYTAAVFGDEQLNAWQALCDPGADYAFLFEIVDGRRRASCERPFAERLFETQPVEIAGLEPGWFKVMGDDDW